MFNNDQVCLSLHYSLTRGTVNKPALHETYTAIFVEQSEFPL